MVKYFVWHRALLKFLTSALTRELCNLQGDRLESIGPINHPGFWTVYSLTRELIRKKALKRFKMYSLRKYYCQWYEILLLLKMLLQMFPRNIGNSKLNMNLKSRNQCLLLYFQFKCQLLKDLSKKQAISPLLPSLRKYQFGHYSIKR